MLFHHITVKLGVSVTGNRYVEMLQSFISVELNNFSHIQENWFQQDGATSHIARQSLEAVQELCGNRVISRFGNVYWPLYRNFSSGNISKETCTRLNQEHWIS